MKKENKYYTIITINKNPNKVLKRKLAKNGFGNISNLIFVKENSNQEQANEYKTRAKNTLEQTIYTGSIFTISHAQFQKIQIVYTGFVQNFENVINTGVIVTEKDKCTFINLTQKQFNESEVF